MKKAVIIGHGYTSRLGMIRSLGQAGYDITVIVMAFRGRDGKTLDTTRPVDCYSKYVSRYLFCPASDSEALIGLLLGECVVPGQKVLLIPDSDTSEAAVDLHYDRLKEHFLMPNACDEQGAVVRWMDKSRQKELARKVGLNVAGASFVEVKDGKYEIPSDISYPCFPKPLATIVGGKGGLRRCDSEQELCSVIETLARRNPSLTVMIEEYKEIGTEYAVVGFSDGAGVVIPAILQILSLACGGHFGVAKQGRVMPVAGFEDIVDKFKAFVEETGFAGVFDIDFYESGGELYFGEMNFRCGGSGYAVTKMGVNLPVMLAKTFAGDGIDDMCREVKGSAVYVNERMLKDDWMAGYISAGECRRISRSSDISFIFDTDDPEPGRQFNKDYLSLRNNMKRFVKRILNRK